jgi:hypothetical protein
MPFCSTSRVTMPTIIRSGEVWKPHSPISARRFSTFRSSFDAS